MQCDFWNWSELAADAGGHWLVEPEGSSQDGISGVTDDSRQGTPGCLFIAIRGELADGHNYIMQALDKGAAAVCVDQDLPREVTQRLRTENTPALRVADSLDAFQNLAHQHRRRFRKLLVVAITGSCGKTSCKEMIAAVLERAHPGAVLKTEGNTNNHFGVPRNLLRLNHDHKAAVLELGSNHPGEISALAALVEPDIAVVANIGPAHLEFFGDLAGVAREKGSIFEQAACTGVAIFHGDAPHADELRRRAGPRRILTFGSGAGNDILIDYRGRSQAGWAADLSWRTSGATERLIWPIAGAHQALNAGAAAAVGTAAGMAPAAIVDALADARLPRMRMEVLRDQSHNVWVNDAYNANPASMRAGISSFLELAREGSAGPRIFVLGDMLELGVGGDEEHGRLLDWVHSQDPDAAILAVGPLMTRAAIERGIRNFPSAQDARGALEQHLAGGAWVFLKGSRGIALDVLVPADAVPESND